ncbi:MAG: hypothetical protein ACI4OJ_05400 [Lachnospiraceae bacterium]
MKTEQTAVIAICDRETEYACHLGEYLKSGASFPIRIRIFTGAEKLLSILDPEETALLVIAESEYNSAVENAGFPAVLLLNESGRFFEQPKNVSKYQSMDVLAGEIFSLCRTACAGEAPSVHHGAPLVRIGLFTPCTRSLQTTLALSLCEVLAERGKVLYLNFEPFPACSVFSQGTSGGNLRELLFTSDTDREKFAERLAGAAERIAHFDTVPPIPSLPELSGIEPKQWLDLLDAVGSCTDYQYVVLDLTPAAGGFLDLLETCSRVWTITGKGRIPEAKLSAYQKLLKSGERERIIAATRYLSLPVFSALPESMEEIGRGPLAAYVRELCSDVGY